MSAEAENIHPLINDKLFQYLLKEIEANYICKSGNDSLMTDPVVLETGQIYQYDNIKQWLISTKKTTCPLTNIPLNTSSKKNTSSSRISGFLVYDVPRIKTILQEKIKKITEILEEYVFDYDIRTLESYLEEKYFDVISKIQTYKKEKADWEGAAIFGDEKSMENRMNVLYKDGPNQDKQKALKWAEKLVNHYDNENGKIRLAHAYDIGECEYEIDKRKATDLYEQVVENGIDIYLNYYIGDNYESGGNNLEKNEKKACDWFGKGHIEGYFMCSVRFANCCHDGTGCKVDKQKAGEIYKKISKKMMEPHKEKFKKSLREACYNYGTILFENDDIGGLPYIECAQKNGCEKAKKKLERMLRAWREDEEESNGESEQENDEEEEASDEEDASDQEENADY
tara:strand:+ start:1001 stop:2194 length:1194 start_codon:yes stop_codon:yes gene_type:complete